jgi:hypothetical protein
MKFRRLYGVSDVGEAAVDIWYPRGASTFRCCRDRTVGCRRVWAQRGPVTVPD